MTKIGDLRVGDRIAFWSGQTVEVVSIARASRKGYLIVETTGVKILGHSSEEIQGIVMKAGR